MNSHDEKWHIVKHKKRECHSKQEYKSILNVDDIKKGLMMLQKYSPKCVFLYGSTARGTNKLNSDIDILIIWKNRVPHNISEIKDEIRSYFHKSVDMVSLIYRGKIMFYDDDQGRTESFLNNIITECILVLGNGDKTDIKLSEYIGKV